MPRHHFLAVFLLLVYVRESMGGCNVRTVQVATETAQQAAVSAITSAFAACSLCPCQIKIRSQAKVVAGASSDALIKESREKRAGNCDIGTAVANASASGDAAGDISTAISKGLSEACGGNLASSEADSILAGLGEAAAKAENAAAQQGGMTSTSAQSEISGQLEGIFAESLSTAVAKCKCGGGNSGGAGSAAASQGKGGGQGDGNTTTAAGANEGGHCPAGLRRLGKC